MALPYRGNDFPEKHGGRALGFSATTQCAVAENQREQNQLRDQQRLHPCASTSITTIDTATDAST
jgi:hypothetical protein